MTDVTVPPASAHARVRRLAGLAMAVAVSVTAASPVSAAPADSRTARVIIRLVPGADVAAQARSAANAGADVSHLYTRALAGFAARVPEAALPGLRRNPRVLSIEPDATVRMSATQSTSVWGLDRIDQREVALDGRFTTSADGAGVTAYIVDSGIRADHVDFGARVRSGFTAITDGLGTSDCDGHGTHVAGTVGGQTFGVAKASSLVAVRVLDCNGAGSVSGILAALDWVIADHLPGVPAVANLSLGTAANASLDAAVEAVIADGVTVVAAAGNTAENACMFSPARVPSAVTVGATDTNDARAWFSNYGRCLDLFAPGVDVPSAWITSPTAAAAVSGTSMAAPHVAGAAAALLSAEPGLMPADVSARLLGTGTTALVNAAGTGSPNRLLFLPTGAEPAGVPGAPTILAAYRGNASALVRWSAGDPGVSEITGYDVRVLLYGKLVKTVAVTGPASSVTVTGLSNGRRYFFWVAARNGSGRGRFTAKPSVAMPATVPGRPAVGTASSGASGGAVNAVARWAAPASGGSPIRGYRVRALRLNSSGRVVSITTSPVQYPWRRSIAMALPAGRYQFQIYAANVIGRGTWSARSGIVAAR